jgi:hypothetical protein
MSLPQHLEVGGRTISVEEVRVTYVAYIDDPEPQIVSTTVIHPDDPLMDDDKYALTMAFIETHDMEKVKLLWKRTTAFYHHLLDVVSTPRERALRRAKKLTKKDKLRILQAREDFLSKYDFLDAFGRCLPWDRAAQEVLATPQ